MANPYDPKKICAQILAGQHDDDLEAIQDAMVERIRTGGLKARWRMRPPNQPDLVVTEDDLTLGECASIERLCRVPWTAFNPTATAFQAQALLTVVLQGRVGMSEADAVAEADKLTALQAVDMFDSYVTEESPIDSPTEAQTS